MSVTDSQPFIYQRDSWPADPRQLAPLRAAARRWLEPSDLGEGLIDDLVMAVSEAASNAVEHAYHPVTAQSTVEVTLQLDHGNIDIEIVDHGRWQPPATEDAGRGRGITLIRHMVDAVIIHFDSSGTRVLLHHRVPARGGVPEIDVHRHDVEECDDGQEALTG